VWLNNPFAMVVAIVFIACCAGVLKQAISSRQRAATRDEEIDRLAERMEQTFANRLDKLEERMANIESIVLERERLGKFDNL